MSDFIQAAGNHFPELEAAAERIRAEMGAVGAGPGSALETRLDSGLRTRLARAHSIEVEIRPDTIGRLPDGMPSHVHFDAKAGVLRLAECMPPTGRTFELARRLALAAAGPELESAATRASASAGARALLRHGLSGYLAAAILMPYAAFLAAAHDLRHDIELLSGRFGVSFEQACRRLATLQRPGAEGIPFHFLCAGITGNVTEKFSASGLPLPRFGGACPRWNLHTAFLDPGRIQTQVARMPDGAAYLFLARAETRPGLGYHESPRHLSVSLGCELSFADAIVYADGLDFDDKRTATPVGTHCRQCPRQDCADRAAPSISR